MSDVRIRRATDDDYEAVAAVLERIGSADRRTADELRARDRATRASGMVCDRVVATIGAEAVGYGVYGALDWCDDPALWSCGVYVVPLHRRTGIGSRIHEAVATTARRSGIERMFGQAAEDDPSGPAFATAHGYRRVGVDFESSIDLDATGSIGSTNAGIPGVDIMTLRDAMGACADWFERLHALYSTIEADIPSPVPIRPVPVATFRGRHVESAAAIPEAFFIAVADGEWIGLTELRRIEVEPTWLRQELTGVVRAYRRRGVATHLKRVGLEWARDHGFVCVTTSNSSRNAGMLAVNERLGYRRGHAVGLWLRDG